MRLLRAPISTLVAIISGFAVLVSLLVPGFEDLRASILGWAMLLAAVALLLGLANLFQVHFEKVRNNENGLYSSVLLVVMLATFVITLWQGRQGPLAEWLFNYVQIPLETSLMAVLAVTLTMAAARMVQSRSNLASIVFLITLFILLLGSGPLFGLEMPIFTRTLTPYFRNVLSIGALRGLLIGVALGTLATGLRVLLGADRPYGG